MSSIVQCINSAFAACASNRSVRAPPHISLLYFKKYCWRSENKLQCFCVFNKLTYFGLKCTKYSRKFRKKFGFSTSQEDTFDILLWLNRNILIFYYQFRRDCCFVLNELNICKAITIIIINNVWTLFRLSGIDTLHVQNEGVPFANKSWKYVN